MYERYWLITYTHNGFKFVTFVYGTEEEMQEYMKSELGYIPAYSGATDDEVKYGEKLGLSAYLAPKIKH